MKPLLLCALLLLTVARADASEGNQVVLYDGYGSGERFVVEGRVIETKRVDAAKDGDSWLRNLWRNLGLMKNSEREDFALTLKLGDRQFPVTSNEEGFFRLDTPAVPPLAAGWHSLTADAVKGKRTPGSGRLLIVPPANTQGVISDIDDTVIVSDVLDKKKLLEKTFLQNPLQRQTFPGTAAYYKKLLAQNPQANAAPMFYLSASPRQLSDNIAAFLAQNDFPIGVLLTKRISGDGRDPLLDQQKYKISKIEAILAALPWVRFTLVGDDGERDPEIYQAIQEKNPERVSAIYIRKVHPDPKRPAYAGQLDLAGAIDKANEAVAPR